MVPVKVSGTTYVGGLSGYRDQISEGNYNYVNDSKVIHSFVIGSYTSGATNSYAGGMVGTNGWYSAFYRCIVENSTISGAQRIGGFSGGGGQMNACEIRGCDAVSYTHLALLYQRKTGQPQESAVSHGI